MPYFPTLNEYLHQSSLLIQAYPTTRIGTKYSLPRRPRPGSKSKTPAPSQPTKNGTDTHPTALAKREPREPSATLTLKTFHPESGICLKYQTDKAAEVGRLMMGLGRLAKGELIAMPASIPGAKDKMDLDGGVAADSEVKPEEKVVAAAQLQSQTQNQQAGGGGGGKKKKKGKK